MGVPYYSVNQERKSQPTKILFVVDACGAIA